MPLGPSKSAPSLQAVDEQLESERERRDKLTERERVRGVKIFAQRKIMREGMTHARKAETSQAKENFRIDHEIRVERWTGRTQGSPLETDQWHNDELIYAAAQVRDQAAVVQRKNAAKYKSQSQNAVIYAGLAEKDELGRLRKERRALEHQQKELKALQDLEKVNVKVKNVEVMKQKFQAEMNARPQLQRFCSDYYTMPILDKEERAKETLKQLENVVLTRTKSPRDSETDFVEFDEDGNAFMVEKEPDPWDAVETVFDALSEPTGQGLSMASFEKIFGACGIIGAGRLRIVDVDVIYANIRVAGRRKFIRFEAFKEACRLVAEKLKCSVEDVQACVALLNRRRRTPGSSRGVTPNSAGGS